LGGARRRRMGVDGWHCLLRRWHLKKSRSVKTGLRVSAPTQRPTGPGCGAETRSPEITSTPRSKAGPRCDDPPLTNAVPPNDTAALGTGAVRTRPAVRSGLRNCLLHGGLRVSTVSEACVGSVYLHGVSVSRVAYSSANEQGAAEGRNTTQEARRGGNRKQVSSPQTRSSQDAWDGRSSKPGPRRARSDRRSAAQAKGIHFRQGVGLITKGG
jgi:hypothetical protein